MSAEREHITPLATAAADRPTSDEEDPSTTSPTPPSSRHRHRCLICCGSCTALVVVIAVVLVVIALTVYKVKEPVMTMNSVSIKNLKLKLGSSLNINMTVVADVSVKNPNAASFRFGESATALYYRAREMGVAYGPPGTAAAHKTFRINVTVDVMTDRLLSDPNVMGDLAAGKLDVTTSTKVGGRVKIFLIIKRHVDVMMNCSITLAASNQSILAQTCNQRVWL
ncbi:putative Late embryogenesis abundant protein [Cocos nucifera]|uniref:Putative Late embryogenesis abundant protein n=1 Tax=Cocos nucifera TaxID=13894 RepID=A0A8K0I3G5_COCNU|nr:putative Late embryogenesis abundant protein [Cocos nucifera]